MLVECYDGCFGVLPIPAPRLGPPTVPTLPLGWGYFSKEELQKESVFPKILKDEMREDYKYGFPVIKFIGVETDT